MRLAALILLASLSLALTGCALTSTATPTSQPGIALTGAVHGGQQPITGAHVYLYAANTTGMYIMYIKSEQKSIDTV